MHILPPQIDEIRSTNYGFWLFWGVPRFFRSTFKNDPPESHNLVKKIQDSPKTDGKIATFYPPKTPNSVLTSVRLWDSGG